VSGSELDDWGLIASSRNECIYLCHHIQIAFGPTQSFIHKVSGIKQLEYDDD
jgi:hypothetical protein